MTFAKQYTQREMDFIREHWRTMTAAQMASELGRSERGVYKKIADMHLRDEAGDAAAGPMHESREGAPSKRARAPERTLCCIGPAKSDHDRLAGLRDLIWDAMQGASPADVARLSPEFRKTIEEMRRLDADGAERAGQAEGPGDLLAEVLQF